MSMTLATDHANLGTVWTIRECARDARNRRKLIQSYLDEFRIQHLLFWFKILVRRFSHLVLLGQVDPELETTRFGLSRIANGHLSMNDWKERISWRVRLYCSNIYFRGPVRKRFSYDLQHRIKKEGRTAHIHWTPPSRMTPE